jgi:TonB-dependent receptor
LRRTAAIAISNRSLSKALLLTSSALVALGAPISAAYAQDTQAAAQQPDQPQPDAQQQEASEGDETIVVTGYRQSINKSLRQKRDANAVVEVITAEDISKFPDKNVADALQRVPGVVISRDGGEGKNVTVRGLASDLTLTQLNGNYVASAEPNDTASRSFNYTLLPSNMLASAELFKTPEARLDEGGIGGTVILHTRRPLDLPAWSGFVTAEGTYADTTKKVDPQLSGMISWKNQDETFGVLLGATRQKRTNRTLSATTEDWRWYSDLDPNDPSQWTDPPVDVDGNPFPADVAAQMGFVGNSGFNDQFHQYTGPFPLPGLDWGGNGGTAAGGGWSYFDRNTGEPTSVQSFYSGFFMPTSVNFHEREEKRTRLGIQATAQFKPTDNLTLTTNYFRFKLDGNYIENQLKIPEWNLARLPLDGNWATGRQLSGLTFDRSGTIVTGAEFETIAGNFYPCNEDQAAAAGLPPGGWGGDSCAMPTPAMRSVFSRESALSQTVDFGAEWNHDAWQASFKGGKTWAKGGPKINFWVQAKPRREISPGVWERGNTFTSWDLTGTPSATFSPDLQENLLNGAVQLDPGSTFSSWQRNTVKQTFAQLDVTRDFDNGWLDSVQLGVKYRNGKARAQQGNTYWYCPGTTRRYQETNDHPEDCAGLPDPSLAIPGLINESPASNFPGGFEVSAFPTINVDKYIDYLNSTYDGPIDHPENQFVYNNNEKILAGYLQANFRLDRLRGNLGLRVIRTKQNVTSTALISKFLEASETVIDSVTVSTVDDSFTDILPSLNFAYDVTPNLVLRGAASKVIARPSFTEPDGTTRLTFYSQEYVQWRSETGGAPQQGWHGSGLGTVEPFSAKQFDLGLEWYFHPGSVLGAALFLKKIDNFIVPIVRDQDLVVEGETVTVNGFSTTANGRKGTSKGFEIYAQHSFDFGLGFQANYTYNKTNQAEVVIDGETVGSSPLVGSAKWQANATVFYETKKLLARASYNKRGTVVGGTNNGLTTYLEPFDQLDLNVAYNLTDKLTLTGSVLNATKSEQRAHLGNDTEDRFLSNSYSGRIFYLGATYKF